MRNLLKRQSITTSKDRVKKLFNYFFRNGGKGILEGVLTLIILISFVALCSLVYYEVRPMRTADIKVPVATDKANYYAGQEIRGIFFGEVYYNGTVQVLREVFCANYQGFVLPPTALTDQGNGIVTAQSRARVLEGETIAIGFLPKDIPLGNNCILRFTNIYTINTPFGERKEEYRYYTQNFSIITEERRHILDDPNQ